MQNRNDTADTPKVADGRFERLHRFHGGLVLPSHNEESTSLPITNAGIPPQLVLPLLQHIGDPAECLVKPGERVLKGQMIAAGKGSVSSPVHAPSSGIVGEIEDRAVPHPSGLKAPCIVIETDGRDEWIDTTGPIADFHQADAKLLRQRIRQSGIVGLGGAGFPTEAKLNQRPDQRIDLLVINGVECEPYISCDFMMMKERAQEILEGVRILQHILQARDCIITIEENMEAAETAMWAAISTSTAERMNLVRIPEIYPSGGERQLIRLLTGQEVPSQGFPADIGIVCQNVATAAAVYRAVVLNQPLISRVVTVTGSGVKQPRNIEVLIGSPFRYAIDACGGYLPDADRLLMGGPMMGFCIQDDATPIIKTTNCILSVTREEMPPPPPALPCIRCGECTAVCPVDLLPQQLYWHAKSGNLDKTQDYNLFDCIECGCCAYVCPSHIPLVQYYRHAKAAIWEQEKQKKAADIARRRHEARQERLERIKRERAEKLARKKQALSGEDSRGTDPKKAAIQAALERVKQKKAQSAIVPKNVENLTAEQQQKISDIDRRRESKDGGKQD